MQLYGFAVQIARARKLKYRRPHGVKPSIFGAEIWGQPLTQDRFLTKERNKTALFTVLKTRR
jgi:hypothetical protein